LDWAGPGPTILMVETATNDAEEEGERGGGGGGGGWPGGGGIVVDGGSRWRCCGVKRWFLLFSLLFLGVYSFFSFPLSVSFCFALVFFSVLLSLSSLCLFYFVLLASNIFFLSPTNSLLYVCLYCFPLCSPSFTSLPLLCFLLQNCPVHPPLYNLTCFPPSPPVEGGIYRGRGSGSYPTPISDEDRVRWLSWPLCSCLEPPAGHTSHAPPMMVAGHEGHGFILGFRQVGRERERENVGEQNFFFSCYTSKARRSTVPCKTTLFCAFF